MKKLYVKVPTRIVRNEDIFISNDEFLLYSRLCFLYFKNYQDKNIKLDHKKLMQFCFITDTRTFKKRLKRLYELGLIENEIGKLSTKGHMTIVFNDELYEKQSEPFTIIDAKVFTYIQTGSIDSYAFRQLFYYKSHINLDDKEKDRSFCFVGYETLSSRLKVGKTKIHNANKLLEDHKLVKIKKHILKTDYEYDDNDELIFYKYNNHYTVSNDLF